MAECSSTCEYYTVEDVRAFRVNCADLDLDACSDEDIQEAIDFATEELERITGDRFCQFEATYVFYGNCRCFLPFCPRVPYRLLEVTSVTNLTTGKEITNYTNTGRGLDLCCPSDCACTDPSKWPAGCDNIEVVGTWGHSCTPKAILRAIKLLILHELGAGAGGCTTGSPGEQDPRIRKVDFGDFTVEYFETPYEKQLVGDSTGIFAVDRLLARHINHSCMFVSLSVD